MPEDLENFNIHDSPYFYIGTEMSQLEIIDNFNALYYYSEGDEVSKRVYKYI